MPVHFKGQSEYKKHYKWADSFRSKEFVPSPEQAADAAGMASVYSSKGFEPPLQHKKRLDGPPTSLSTNYFSVPSKSAEFTLLGQQDKFSSNVPYQLKDTASHSKVYKNKENFDDPPPPSKQLKMQKRIKPLLKERHPPMIHNPKFQPPSEISVFSPPPAPREEKLRPSEPVKEAMKDKDLKDVLGEAGMEKQVKSSVQKEESVPKANMNAFVQTDMKKGLALSGPEAPAEYSLKYKAGVAPPRPPRKFSEYQKQFQWKKGMKASPLLAAEQIVYKSSTDLGPYKIDPTSKMSEYKRQFQQWKPIDSNMDLSLKLDAVTGVEQDKLQKKKKKVKRSKSAGAVLHSESNAEGDMEEDGQEVDEAAELKAKLKQTHGKIKRLGSEYHANFKSPAAYAYKKGAWKGANPPQLTPAAGDVDVAESESKEQVPLDNWFAEVIELRRRANEYRKRARGTHFSREHLVQLMAKQTDFWDLQSQASETVKALDLEAPKVSQSRMSKNVPEGDSPVLSDFEYVAPEQPAEVSKKERTRVAPRSRKMAFLEEQQEKVANQIQKLEEAEAKMDEDNGVVEEEEGRRPTPLLQQEKGASRRHHLDLTTPAIGGALLTCPPAKNSKMIITSRSGDSYVTASDDYEMKNTKKSYNMDKLITMPILGMPSGDTHALRDDDAESDKVLETRYVPTPLLHNEDDKENDPEVNVVKKSRKSGKGRQVSKPSHLSDVKEGQGKTYSKQNIQVTLDDIRGHKKDQDDDAWSVSMMSVASSASLATEVLERARRRREEFWGKKN